MSVAASRARVGQRGRARSSPWRDAWRRYRRNRLAMAGGTVASIIVLLAIFAPLLAPYRYDYAVLAQTLQGPSLQHPLGTDEIGRDLLSRIIYGARTSMTVGFFVPLIGTAIGLPIGAVAAWFGGYVDFVVQRLFEAMAAIPSLLVALLLISIYGAGLDHLILFMGITGWVGSARYARAMFLALRDREFVTAARAIGTPSWRIMLVHLLPNAAGPLIVGFAMAIPGAIFGEAGLSFLGLGVQDPIPSWGKMISESAPYFQNDPLLGLIPVVCIALTMLSFSFVGDGLRDALDPSALE